MRYVNDLPIFGAVDAGAVQFPGELVADVPATLNRMMREGALDMGPVSAFEYASNPDRYVLLPDLCIGARDELVSVLLISQTPPALLGGKPISVTAESASGAHLLRIIMERRYGVSPLYEASLDPLERARAGEPAMVIGDAAIDAQFEFPAGCIYDLGTLWRDFTGEQSITAVWVARREVFEQNVAGVQACMHALTDAYSWARSHREEIVAQAQRMHTRPQGFYEAYYGKLNFTFHSAAQRGLLAFCRELCAIGAIDRIPPVTPEVLGVAR